MTPIDGIAHLPQSIDAYRDAYGSRKATKWTQQTGHRSAFLLLSSPLPC
jgi:hypothetical protein